MEKNVLFLLTPKAQVACLDENTNVRQAIEKMKVHGFSAIPLIDKDGVYKGMVSEGDLLRHILSIGSVANKDLEKTKIKDIVQLDTSNAIKVGENIAALTKLIVNYNFIAVVDDRNVFMGIVTRKMVMNLLLGNI